MIYDIGDAPKLTATFTNLQGTAEDPATLEFKLLAPDGTETTFPTSAPEVGNEGAGIWTFQLPVLTTDGIWRVRAVGLAGVIAAEELSVRVRPSLFA